jgi:hypothetical protein
LPADRKLKGSQQGKTGSAVRDLRVDRSGGAGVLLSGQGGPFLMNLKSQISDLKSFCVALVWALAAAVCPGADAWRACGVNDLADGHGQLRTDTDEGA